VEDDTEMKVLHVVRSLVAGGAERVVVEYASAHDRDRYEPEVCCLAGAGPLEKSLRERGVPVHVLGHSERLGPRSILSLARLIRSGSFDVVHNHNSGPVNVGVPAAVLSRVRAVVRTSHNVSVGAPGERRLLSRLAALREDAQIAVSQGVRESQLRAGRIPEHRFVTIRNGIDDRRLALDRAREDVRAELGIGPGEVVCLAVGSLTPQKNYWDLLKVAQRTAEVAPAVRFLVAGGGPLKDELVTLARETGLGNTVQFLGERLDIPVLLRGADVFVLTSSWEGLPITVLEAMASGVPCVATAVGGTPEAIADGVSGYVVPAGDVAGMVEVIVRLADDPELRGRVAREARARYERSFTGAGMVRQTEALYDLALSGRADLARQDRVKILFLIGQLKYGGAERQLLELATRLPRDLFDPVVCSLGDAGPIGREMEEGGVRVICLHKTRGPFSTCSRSLLEVIRAENPVILQTYLFAANWRGLLVGRYARVPVLVSSVRNVDIHSRRSMVLLERLLAILVDRVIANAGAVKEFVSRAHGIDPEKIRVIYNGVSIDRIDRSAQNTRSDAWAGGERVNGKTVAMIASLTRKKDHSTFLAAAARVRKQVPDARIIAVGGGPLRERLVERADALGLRGEEIFVGETSDIAGVLASADVSVLTSLKEGCSNAILESMAAGRPVVVTDVGGNPELVEDGITGFVVPSGDAEAVARRVVDLLGDEELRAAMGKAGRKRAVEAFAVERMVEATVGFYAELLEERVPGLLRWVEATAARGGRRDRGRPGASGFRRGDG